MPKRNYHKESGYAAQRKWSSEHLVTINFMVHKEQKELLVKLSQEKGIPLSQLIKQALDAQYGLALSKPKDNPPAG